MVSLSMTLMTSDQDFKVMAFLKSTVGKDNVSIAQEKTIPNIWNGTMIGDLD